MTKATSSAALVIVLMWSATGLAHGTSNLEATFDVQPADARPGASATIEVTLVELQPGAAEGALVDAAIFAAGGAQRIALTRDGLVFRGAFTLREGSHDLRVYIVRGDKREVAMSGFQVGAALEPIPALSRKLFFNPAGRFDAIPSLDNVSGAVGGFIALIAILALIRRPRRAGAPDPEGAAAKPVWLLLLAATGALMMPLGGHWDVAFHMDAGREGLFSPPHRLIYGGILLSMVVIGAALLRKPQGTTWLAHWRSDAAAFAAGIAMAAQLASAPFDELWHNLFGLDVSVWSPPHALLIGGATAVCLTLASISVRGPLAVVSAARLLAVAAALLAIDVFLAESVYPMPAWHMSQHRPAFVFPLLEVVGATLAALVASRVVALRFAGTAAVAVFLALRLAVYPFLALLGVTATPRFPLWLLGLVVVGILVDVLAGRRRA